MCDPDKPNETVDGVKYNVIEGVQIPRKFRKLLEESRFDEDRIDEILNETSMMMSEVDSHDGSPISSPKQSIMLSSLNNTVSPVFTFEDKIKSNTATSVINFRSSYNDFLIPDNIVYNPILQSTRTVIVDTSFGQQTQSQDVNLDEHIYSSIKDGNSFIPLSHNQVLLTLSQDNKTPYDDKTLFKQYSLSSKPNESKPHLFQQISECLKDVLYGNKNKLILLDGFEGNGQIDCLQQCLHYVFSQVKCTQSDFKSRILNSLSLIEALQTTQKEDEILNSRNECTQIVSLHFNKFGMIKGAKITPLYLSTHFINEGRNFKVFEDIQGSCKTLESQQVLQLILNIIELSNVVDTDTQLYVKSKYLSSICNILAISKQAFLTWFSGFIYYFNSDNSQVKESMLLIARVLYIKLYFYLIGKINNYLSSDESKLDPSKSQLYHKASTTMLDLQPHKRELSFILFNSKEGMAQQEHEDGDDYADYDDLMQDYYQTSIIHAFLKKLDQKPNNSSSSNLIQQAYKDYQGVKRQEGLIQTLEKYIFGQQSREDFIQVIQHKNLIQKGKIVFKQNPNDPQDSQKLLVSKVDSIKNIGSVIQMFQTLLEQTNHKLVKQLFNIDINQGRSSNIDTNQHKQLSPQKLNRAYSLNEASQSKSTITISMMYMKAVRQKIDRLMQMIDKTSTSVIKQVSIGNSQYQKDFHQLLGWASNLRPSQRVSIPGLDGMSSELSFKQVIAKFKCVNKTVLQSFFKLQATINKCQASDKILKAMSITILSTLYLQENIDFQVQDDSNCIWITENSLSKLESLSRIVMISSIRKVQRNIKTKFKKNITKFLVKATKIQAWFRSKIRRQSYLKIKRSCFRIQAGFKSYKIRKCFYFFRQNIKFIQCYYRFYRHMKQSRNQLDNSKFQNVSMIEDEAMPKTTLLSERSSFIHYVNINEDTGQNTRRICSPFYPTFIKNIVDKNELQNDFQEDLLSSFDKVPASTQTENHQLTISSEQYMKIKKQLKEQQYEITMLKDMLIKSRQLIEEEKKEKDSWVAKYTELYTEKQRSNRALSVKKNQEKHPICLKQSFHQRTKTTQIVNNGDDVASKMSMNMAYKTQVKKQPKNLKKKLITNKIESSYSMDQDSYRNDSVNKIVLQQKLIQPPIQYEIMSELERSESIKSMVNGENLETEANMISPKAQNFEKYITRVESRNVNTTSQFKGAGSYLDHSSYGITPQSNRSANIFKKK